MHWVDGGDVPTGSEPHFSAGVQAAAACAVTILGAASGPEDGLSGMVGIWVASPGRCQGSFVSALVFWADSLPGMVFQEGHMGFVLLFGLSVFRA